MPYALAAVLAGGAAAFVSGYAGQLLPAGSRTVLAVIGLGLLAMREAGLVALPIPQTQWRVPRLIVSGPGWTGALVWGTVLGLGFVTHVKFAVFWGMHLVVFAVGSPWFGASVGAWYGLSRAIPALLLSVSPTLQKKWLMYDAPVMFSYGMATAKVGAVTMIICAALLLID